MSQAFYRKWRPRQWQEVIGQEHIIQTLQNAVASNRIAHAYLFAGPRGTGKTTTARLLAKAINCTEPDRTKRPCNQCEICQAINNGRLMDLIEIDAASNTSVEDVRDLRDKVNFSPSQGAFKVYIIDEVHMLSTAAFNALLKTLEEPPPHAIFILATTEVHKIPATVLSRCQRHEFRRISVANMVKLLQDKSDEEGLKANSEALTLIARQATGSLRDAISLLDQLASMGENITLELAQTVLGSATSQTVIDLVEAILAQDAATGMQLIQSTLDAGIDSRQFARQMVDYLRNMLLIQMNNASQVDTTQEIRTQLLQQSGRFDRQRLLKVIRDFNTAASELKSGWQTSLPLELAFANSLTSEKESRTAQDDAPTTAKPAATAPKQKEKVKTSSEEVTLTSAQGAKPAPSPSTQQKATDNSPKSHVTLQIVTQNWPKILAAVRQQNPNTYGLLNSNKNIDLIDNVLQIGFASEVLKKQIEKAENNEIVTRALTSVLNESIPVRYAVVGAKSDAPPEVDGDGMVATALRIGGEIADINNFEK